MGILIAARDVGSDINGVKTTFSSWDSCMSKAYCKWPVIVGIIIGALIVFSLISCLVRCLCCGVECCCGCLSCCNACCPSPRRRQGYQQQPPPPPTPYQQYPAYNQYQQPQAPPVYSSGGLGYRSGPQTATFDSPSRNKPGAAASHPDGLPAMPTWESARTHRVEEEDDMEDVEMEKLVSRPPPAQSPQPPWQQHPESRPLYNGSHGGGATPTSPYGEQPFDDHFGAGAMVANPYHEQQHYPAQQRQQSTSPYPSSRPPPPGQSSYPPTYRSQPTTPYTRSPPPQAQSYPSQQTTGGGGGTGYGGYAPYNHNDSSHAYESYNGNGGGHDAYGSTPSYPPSYATAPQPPSGNPSAARPPSGLQIGRRPVQGSWREV